MKYIIVTVLLLSAVFSATVRQLWPSVPVPIYAVPDITTVPIAYITNRSRTFIVGLSITNSAPTNRRRAFDASSTNQFYWICLTNTSTNYGWTFGWTRNRKIEIVN